MKSLLGPLIAAIILPVHIAAAAENPINIEAQETKVIGNVAYASGRVTIRHDGAILKADSSIYDPATGKIVLRGNVKITKKDGETVNSSSAVYSVKSGAVESMDPDTATLDVRAGG